MYNVQGYILLIWLNLLLGAQPSHVSKQTKLHSLKSELTLK